MPRKTPEQKLFSYLPALSIVGSFFIIFFAASRNLATVPYVDAKHEEALKYTDNQAKVVLDKSYDHSDKNRSDMTGMINAQGAKLDMIVEILKDVRQQQSERQRK